MGCCSFVNTFWCVEISPFEAATQQAAVADAALRPRDRGFLTPGIGPIAFPFYRGGAAKRQAVSPLSLII
jgi:hypothetical protein